MILFSSIATGKLDRIYTDRSIYDIYQHFADWFIKWNYEFHQYVRESKLSSLAPPFGVYTIGTIGTLDYVVRTHMGTTLIVVTDFHFPSFTYTSSYTPHVNIFQSPKYIWTPPQKTSFVLPTKTKILNGSFYDGIRIGYYNKKYTILKSDGTPLVNKWFDKKPKIFNQPFGKCNIIAHVSYFKSLYAISLDGNMFDMHRLWSDANLYEDFIILFDKIVKETLNDHIRCNIILESSNKKVVRLRESQLHNIILDIVKKIIA